MRSLLTKTEYVLNRVDRVDMRHLEIVNLLHEIDRHVLRLYLQYLTLSIVERAFVKARLCLLKRLAQSLNVPSFLLGSRTDFFGVNTE